jgi:hypothetical protein
LFSCTPPLSYVQGKQQNISHTHISHYSTQAALSIINYRSNNSIVRFIYKTLTNVFVEIQISLDITPCRPVNRSGRFGGDHCHHFERQSRPRLPYPGRGNVTHNYSMGLYWERRYNWILCSLKVGAMLEQYQAISKAHNTCIIFPITQHFDRIPSLVSQNQQKDRHNQ